MEELIKTLLVKAQHDGVEKLVVGGVICMENKVLLLRRCPDEYLSGLVELPSGKVDQGEELLQALAREIKEETNLELIAVESYIGSFDYHSGSGKKSRQFNFKIKTDGNIKINPEEHDEYGFYSVNEINGSSLNISEFTKKIILQS
ncbi:NUDIX hydrolase, partial [Chryseobacterium sp. HMWF001]